MESKRRNINFLLYDYAHDFYVEYFAIKLI